ncbi:hypothetical protein JCM10908_002966 [Rhodotorula pacifica]|uniref:uncharacterized protein n=1 Tax=Rhodotorula pacifica TaxID=1495444 RepID=UPI00317970B4
MATAAIAPQTRPSTATAVPYTSAVSEARTVASAVASHTRSLDSSPSRSPDTPRRPRLQRLRGRLASQNTHSHPRSDTEDGSDANASPSRPRLRHRFSRSLTSIVSMRTEAEQEGGSGGGTAAEGEESPLARWRARSKAKLVRAFTPNLEDRSSPSYPSSLLGSSRNVLDAPLPRFAPSFTRSPSRNRSHSAPLLLTRPTELISPAPILAHRLSVLVAPTPPRPATFDSPSQSPFHTCPSSPWTETPFVFTHADPFSAISASPDFNPAEAVAPKEALVARDRFSELPREVQLGIFRALLEVCGGDWRRAVKVGEWTGDAARHRWGHGRANGRRELVKLGRVCKLWRDLSLDGQLWPDAPAASVLGPDVLSTEVVERLTTGAGSFLTTLDARGLGSRLDWKTLSRIVETSRLSSGGGVTRLCKIDLTGCTALTAASLASLLAHSPSLTELHAPGLRCVNEGHMRVLGAECPRLSILDVTRCACLAAAGLLHLPYPPPKQITPGSPPLSGTSAQGLRSLKAGGLSGMNDFIVGAILERHTNLETLDVSFSRLHDDAFKSFVALPADAPAESAEPGPSQAVRSVQPPSGKRCFPALKHLCLTGCTSLTSIGLGHLEDALPNLQILEVARFGVRARTDGIARLLASCPNLRKVDLEDNYELGDDAILALTPSRTSRGAPNLGHLAISACPALTDEAIASVVENSPKLRVLEADGTAITDRTARTFIRLAQERAAAAQTIAAEGAKAINDPLVASRYPAILSVLDNRTTGRRLSRDIGAKHLRPRDGQRGYWTRIPGDYHDDPPAHADDAASPDSRKKDGAILGECDPTRVVVRSFHSALAVDAADAARRARTPATASGPSSENKLGAMRLRSLSDSEVFRRGSVYPNDDNARIGCIIS